MIGSVPETHRGVATGSLVMMFGLGNLLGIAIGSLLMTWAFARHSGLPNPTPTPGDPEALVAALHATFLFLALLSAIALGLAFKSGGFSRR